MLSCLIVHYEAPSLAGDYTGLPAIVTLALVVETSPSGHQFACSSLCLCSSWGGDNITLMT